MGTIADNGLMAEWLGKGLQNLLQRFESASDLTKAALEITLTLFFVVMMQKAALGLINK